eukprot:scaffold6265_cov193-Cylindrotheca_fusiformis.AAC.2
MPNQAEAELSYTWGLPMFPAKNSLVWSYILPLCAPRRQSARYPHNNLLQQVAHRRPQAYSPNCSSFNQMIHVRQNHPPAGVSLSLDQRLENHMV